jgi:hypothetical protein
MTLYSDNVLVEFAVHVFVMKGRNRINTWRDADKDDFRSQGRRINPRTLHARGF